MITVMKGAVKFIDLSQNARKKIGESLILLSPGKHYVAGFRSAVKYKIKG